MARSLLRDADLRDLALSPVQELRAAMTLLTRVPVGAAFSHRSGAAAFGLVGAAIGLAGGVPLLLVGGSLPWVAAILAVGTLAVASGALHLDGLSDTADALVAFGPGAAERARKDPAAGPAGIVALVLVVGLQVASLSALLLSTDGVAAAAMLVLAASVSRSVAVVVSWTQRSAARRSGGAGAAFAEGTTSLAVAATALTTAGLAGAAALLTDPLVAGAAALGGLVSLPIGAVVVRWRHGLDGDGLGAVIELSVTTTLVLATVATVVSR